LLSGGRARTNVLEDKQQIFCLGLDETGNPLNRAHRHKFLLSGLLKCGCCGAD
jgi:hypothetical protein